MLTFGPVPSRRLGNSLGINNIPPKICSYSCIYCQLGRTKKIQVHRQEFYSIDEIVRSVEERLERVKNVDYLAFVPDGEPTLDMNLGKEIDALKQFGIRIAVITNSSLIWDEKVREELSKAEWVSLKVDAVSKEIWKKINRPHKALNLEKILNGIKEFSKEFVTETMLINGVNDNKEELKKIADFLSAIEPKKSYISIPIRPPAEKWVRRASEQAINLAYHIFSERGISVEFLLGYEGNEFAFTGNVEKDLLSITSVHPMRKDAVEEFLRKAEADWSVIERLIKENKLIE
ncbi:MAG: radical SAM protein, partial [Candidatus Hydrothermarchaeota archaeon]